MLMGVAMIFKNRLNLDKIEGLIEKVNDLQVEDANTVLLEAFELVCSKYKIPGGRKSEFSKAWIGFNLLLAHGGSVSAAMMLLPPHRKLTLHDYPDKLSHAVLEAEVSGKNFTFGAARPNPAIAIVVTALKLHLLIYRDTLKKEESENAEERR
jgi:hypothetical protein